MYKSRILLDSVNTSGCRLTTFEIELPKWLLAELNKHRILSSGANSSRAIPLKKVREAVIREPVIPVWFGKAQKGMSADEELIGWRHWLAERLWLNLRYVACFISWLFEKIKLHKQIGNRILEPWMWATVIITGTEWDNFFELRCANNVQPEFRVVAREMQQQYTESTPALLQDGEWHIPMVSSEDEVLPLWERIKVAVGRCGRVSYHTHLGIRDVSQDIRLHDDLVRDKHYTPTEHVAQAQGNCDFIANFSGWKQYRKMVGG